MAIDGILEMQSVSKTFGGLMALQEVSFSIPSHSILVVIGPNGSGKTTLLNLINGFLPLSGGEIRYKGRRIDGLPPERIASLGIGRTFQDLQLFSNMSVLENVMVGRYLHTKARFVSVGLRLPQARREERDMAEAAMSKLALVGLEEKAFTSPSDLSLGQRKLVAFARTLAMEPDMLLLDEPAAGLSVQEAHQLGQWIVKIQESGVSVMLIEHRMDMVMDVAHRIVVLNYGEKIAEGTPSEVQRDKRVIDAYLGKEEK